MTKRIVDLLVAALGLAILSPALIALMIAVKLDSPGPAIFVQQRVGRGGRLFQCYKLRTMREGTLETLTHLSSVSSVTKLGHFLRRSKLDEIPQLYNVFKGDMSLVGPRPGLPGDLPLIQARQKLHVLNVRPGMTGLAQVCGIDMSRADVLAAVDARYVQSKSAWLDANLLVLTVVDSRHARAKVIIEASDIKGRAA